MIRNGSQTGVHIVLGTLYYSTYFMVSFDIILTLFLDNDADDIKTHRDFFDHQNPKITQKVQIFDARVDSRLTSFNTRGKTIFSKLHITKRNRPKVEKKWQMLHQRIHLPKYEGVLKMFNRKFPQNDYKKCDYDGTFVCCGALEEGKLGCDQKHTIQPYKR